MEVIEEGLLRTALYRTSALYLQDGDSARRDSIHRVWGRGCRGFLYYLSYKLIQKLKPTTHIVHTFIIDKIFHF